jgi:hypothetical protein
VANEAWLVSSSMVSPAWIRSAIHRWVCGAITGEPAWNTKPSWYQVSAQERMKHRRSSDVRVAFGLLP